MKRFVIKITIIILPIIFSFSCLEFILRQIPNDYNYKYNYLKKHAAEIETLILGSSHSYYGLNPVYFETNTFNAAHVSQTIEYDYEILMSFKAQFDKLQTIYIAISYHTLYGDLPSWRKRNYVLYYKLKKASELKNYLETLSISFKKNILRASIYILNGTESITCSSLGWGTGYKSENAKNLIESGKIASLRHTRDDITSLKYYTIYDKNIFYLNKLLNLCSEKHINVVLFTPPAFETYRYNLNPLQLNATVESSIKIASKFENCQYINLLNDSDFTERDYFDADHLSEIGAEKLSSKLNKLPLQTLKSQPTDSVFLNIINF